MNNFFDVILHIKPGIELKCSDDIRYTSEFIGPNNHDIFFKINGQKYKVVDNKYNQLILEKTSHVHHHSMSCDKNGKLIYYKEPYTERDEFFSYCYIVDRDISSVRGLLRELPVRTMIYNKFKLRQNKSRGKILNKILSNYLPFDVIGEISQYLSYDDYSEIVAEKKERQPLFIIDTADKIDFSYYALSMTLRLPDQQIDINLNLMQYKNKNKTHKLTDCKTRCGAFILEL